MKKTKTLENFIKKKKLSWIWVGPLIGQVFLAGSFVHAESEVTSFACGGGTLPPPSSIEELQTDRAVQWVQRLNWEMSKISTPNREDCADCAAVREEDSDSRYLIDGQFERGTNGLNKYICLYVEKEESYKRFRDSISKWADIAARETEMPASFLKCALLAESRMDHRKKSPYACGLAQFAPESIATLRAYMGASKSPLCRQDYLNAWVNYTKEVNNGVPLSPRELNKTNVLGPKCGGFDRPELAVIASALEFRRLMDKISEVEGLPARGPNFPQRLLDLAIVGYNAGEGAIDNERLSKETKAYIGKMRDCLKAGYFDTFHEQEPAGCVRIKKCKDEHNTCELAFKNKCKDAKTFCMKNPEMMRVLREMEKN